MKGIYLLLGTNLGEREHNLSEARALIRQKIGKITDSSSIYETAAWGVQSEPDYLNQVISVKTSYPPNELLKAIHQIERQMGRKRIKKWHARIIDIDILAYKDETVSSPSLTIPHPEIKNRLFTLIPLNEIAQNERLPGFRESIENLLSKCPDKLEVKLYQKIKREPA